MGFALDHGDLPQILDRAPCTIQMSTVITIPSHGRLMALPTLIQDMINLCKVHTCVYIYGSIYGTISLLTYVQHSL